MIPNSIAPDVAARAITIADLAANCSGVPAGASIDGLLLTAPPLVRASAVSTNNVQSDVEFTLSIQAAQPTQLTGTVHVQIPLDFQIFLDADGKERLRPSLNAINSVTATLDVGLLTADGVAALLSDTTDTFAYLRIVSGTSIDTAQPLKGVTVELLELDFPAPADDDVVVPATGETVVKTGKFLIDTVTSYEPQRDQVLSTQVTDNFGFARFVGVVNRLGGIFTTIRTWENLMEQ